MKNNEIYINKDRNDFIDYAKAFAIILVIISHSLLSSGENQYANNILYNYIVRMAVPVFVLISGFNFSNSISKFSSMKAWYSADRIKSKLKFWILPMLVVFLRWTSIQISNNPEFSMSEWLKAFILQDYGMGAYYFFIVIELYFMFPIVFSISRKKIGYLYIWLLNLFYEILLYLNPIPQAIYRIIALRYMVHLASGIWVWENVKRKENLRKFSNVILLGISIIMGCLYIKFASCNVNRTNIFKYGTWGDKHIHLLLYCSIILPCCADIRKQKNKI